MTLRRLVPLLALATGAAPAQDNYATERRAVTLNHAQTQFVLHCGGCHGTLGVSPPRSVPSLRGTAGYFLCTPAARAYVVRLPNVARTKLPDAELAEVLNFVMFQLGGTSAPGAAARFTAQEVARIRSDPLNTEPLKIYRRRIVDTLVRHCKAPKIMLEYGEK